MKLLKHKTSRDTAIQVIKQLDNNRASVRFWNVHMEPFLIDLREEIIHLDERANYDVINVPQIT